MKRLFLLVLCLSFLFRFAPWPTTCVVQAEPGAGGEGESAMVGTATWISYTHEPWGLTFHYPANWQLVAPEFEVLAQPPNLPEGYTFNPDMDVLRSIGHGLTLYPPNSGPAGGVKIEIGLEEFLLSSETTLEEWVLLDR